MPGRGWSSPVVAGGRVWLTTSVKANGASLRAVAYDVETGREVGQRRSLSPAKRRPAEREEQSRVADANRRRRSRLRPLRRRRHRGADDVGRDRLEDAAALQSQHGNGGSPAAVRRPADPQLRRQRPGVRRRARQAHRQGAVEDVAPPAVGPGVYDAAVDSRRRTGPAGQRRRLSGRRLRSADGQGNLACQLRRRLLERAASGVSATGSSTSPPDSSSRRCWRCVRTAAAT